MVRKHHVIVLLVNHVNTFYIELCVSNGSHIKYTYMISQKHNHIMLPNYASLSHDVKVRVQNEVCFYFFIFFGYYFSCSAIKESILADTSSLNIVGTRERSCFRY